MAEHKSQYYLPIRFSTTFQKTIKQSSRGMSYENVQFEYLLETYINDENTDDMEEWYFIKSYNKLYKDNSNIVFINKQNDPYIFNNSHTCYAINPSENDYSWSIVPPDEFLYKDDIPNFSETMRVRLYIPKINIAAWGEIEQYIINTYLTFNGKKVYLSSGISKYLSLNADEYIKGDNNQIYSQYLEFYIPSPYSICEDAIWSDFRRNILNINNIINSQQVSFEILPYQNISNESGGIELNDAFNQDNYTWINSNNPWFLTLSNTFNKNLLNIKIVYPNTYLTLKDYLNNFKYYTNKEENSNVSFDITLGIYDLDGNIYWGLSEINEDTDPEEIKKYVVYSWSEDSGVMPEDELIINIKEQSIPFFNKLENYRDDLVVRTFLTIRSDLRFNDNIYMSYPEIQLLSNRIPLNYEIFKYIVNGFEYNNSIKVNFDDIKEMNIYDIKIVNENKKEEILLNNPIITQSVKPVFFRVEILPTLRINKIKENISLNLIDYINKVTYFSLSINGNIIKESGRSGSQVIFNIPGEKIWSELNLTGDINKFNEVNNVYLLTPEGDVITSGKYNFK